MSLCGGLAQNRQTLSLTDIRICQVLHFLQRQCELCFQTALALPWGWIGS